MMTNTYAPHVGGVARSIEAFTNEYRTRGHKVLVISPEFKNQPKNEENIIRVPAIENFNNSDFSVALPVPGIITSAAKRFNPDIIHSHHPFLIGSSALRIAHTHQIPLVFTHHTKYEDYTHYIPGDSELLQRFVIELSTNYANLCDMVFTPSDSIRKIISERGVTTKITTLPTGVDMNRYQNLQGMQFRQTMGIPQDAFVVGHLGRLAKEKNLQFLAQAVATFLKQPNMNHCCFLLVGTGPMQQIISDYFSSQGLSDKLYTAGLLETSAVVNAYHAMDVFAFSSMSETQGMVITEAMAAGTPVVAIDAPGVREVVRNDMNGFLLSGPTAMDFCNALTQIKNLDKKRKSMFSRQALKTADQFSFEKSVDKALDCFEKLRQESLSHRDQDYNQWTHTFRSFISDWERIKEFTSAAHSAVINTIKN